MSVPAITVHLAAFATISALAEAWSALLQVIFNPWGNRQPPTFLDTWSITLLYQVLLFVIAFACCQKLPKPSSSTWETAKRTPSSS